MKWKATRLLPESGRTVVWLTQTMLLLFAIACGCHTAEIGQTKSLHPNIVTNLERGISQSKLEVIIGIPSRHEFTNIGSTSTVRCVSYYFSDYHLKFYFVFTNDALGKVVLPPRFEHELSPWEQGRRAVWKSYDPEERLKVVLQAPDLQPADIAVMIERRYRPKVFDNAFPAAVIAGVVGAPIALAQSPKHAAEEREIQALARRFDPFRAQLTMTVSEIERMFGPALLVEALNDGSEIRYYGSMKLGIEDRLLWVSVVFKNGKVISVFSDEFFDYHKIKEQH